MRRNAIYKIFQGKQTIDVFEEIVSLKKKKEKKKLPGVSFIHSIDNWCPVI